MKLIDTTPITSLAGYPGLAHNSSVQVGLDFMQQAGLDNADALSRAIISNPGAATILSGCVLSSGSISAGWVYYVYSGQGEIFYVPQTTVGSGSGGDIYLNAGWVNNYTDASSPDLTVLSDGSQVSMHNKRTISFAWSPYANYGISGGGALPDFQNWITTQVAQNEADIATNMTDIAANTAAIAINTTDITANTAAIAMNTTDIAANTSAIATNTAAITTINTEITGIDSELTTLTSDIATINSELATHTTDINTINTEITTIDGQITALQVAPVVLKNSNSGISVSSSSWTMLTQVTTPNDTVTRTWKLDFRGYLQTLGNNITEDVNIKFTNVTTSTDYDSTSAGKVSCGSVSYSDAIKDFVGLFTAVLLDVQTIGPGAVIEVQVNTTAGYGVGSMVGCSMVLVEIK